MADNRYNGWTNYETWLANLWIGEICADLQSDLNLDLDDVESGNAAATIKDWFSEVYLNDAPETGFLADAVNAAVSAVNWQEIARTAVEG